MSYPYESCYHYWQQEAFNKMSDIENDSNLIKLKTHQILCQADNLEWRYA